MWGSIQNIFSFVYMSLISLSSVFSFSVHKSFSSLVSLIPKYFILFASYWEWNEVGPLLCREHVQELTKNVSKKNVRAKLINLLGENIRGKLHDIGFADDFLDMTQKA